MESALFPDELCLFHSLLVRKRFNPDKSLIIKRLSGKGWVFPDRTEVYVAQGLLLGVRSCITVGVTLSVRNHACQEGRNFAPVVSVIGVAYRRAVNGSGL